MEYTISGTNVVALAVAVRFLGTFINKKMAFLERYSIPVAVTGGLSCSLVVTAIPPPCLPMVRKYKETG